MDVGEKQLKSPVPKSGLINALRQHYLLRLLVRRELNARYSGSILGMFWSYINPLSQFAVYFFIMGSVFNLHRDVPNFALHIFTALIIVHFFSESFNAGTRSIVQNRAMVKRLPMPVSMFPISAVIVSLYHVGPQLVILAAILLLTGYAFAPIAILYAALALAIIVVMATACALLFSTANVYFRDFANVVSILTSLVTFSVPMIYSYSMVDERFGRVADYYLYNPIADAVVLFQQAFWAPTLSARQLSMQVEPPSLLAHSFTSLAVAIAFLMVAQIVFARTARRVAERL